MRNSLLHFAAIAFVSVSSTVISAQATQQTKPDAEQSNSQSTQTQAQPPARHIPMEAAGNPVADPKAVIVVGNARFTVLTPELIRMEWAADAKFEDHASFVFINRRLPVPKFSKEDADHKLTIKTSALTLKYDGTGGKEGQFTPDNLAIELAVDGKPVTWHPGLTDPENLQGTTRTLDGALGWQDHGSRSSRA